MSAKIVTVFNQQGGVGKTITSMLLASTLALRKNKRALVVDMDEQGTAVRWAALAPDETPFPAAVVSLAQMGGKMHREVRNQIGNYDYIFIDCPPALSSPVASSSLLISDLALIPMVLAPADLWAVVGAKALVENARDQNEGLLSRVLPNMASKKRRTNIADVTLKALEPDKSIPLTENWLGNRTVFRECQAFGCAVQSMSRSGDAITEVEALADEVLALLR